MIEELRQNLESRADHVESLPQAEDRLESVLGMFEKCRCQNIVSRPKAAEFHSVKGYLFLSIGLW